MIKLEYLQYFIEAVKMMSINKAAEKLFVTQSTVSRGIQMLEKELGLQLMVRKHDGIVLTDDGKELLPNAVEVLNAYQRFNNKARKLVTSRTNNAVEEIIEVNVFTSYSLVEKFVPHLLSLLNMHNTRYKINFIEVSAEECDEETIERWLSTPNTLCFLLLSNIKIEKWKFSEHLKIDLMARAKANVMSCQKSRWIPENKSCISLEELTTFPLVCYSNGTLARKDYEIILQKYGELNIIADVTNLSSYLQYIMDDVGVTIATSIYDNMSEMMKSENTQVKRFEHVKYTPLQSQLYFEVCLIYNLEYFTENMKKLEKLIKSMW